MRSVRLGCVTETLEKRNFGDEWNARNIWKNDFFLFFSLSGFQWRKEERFCHISFFLHKPVLILILGMSPSE
jgi:hypothetical protein